MILDTTFLVDLARRDRGAFARLDELEARGETLRVPAPAVFELSGGVERSRDPPRETRAVTEVLEGCVVLPLEPRQAMRAGRVSGALLLRGVRLDPIDALIAGIALEEDDAVLTRNLRHFRRVEDLRVEAY